MHPVYAQAYFRENLVPRIVGDRKSTLLNSLLSIKPCIPMFHSNSCAKTQLRQVHNRMIDKDALMRRSKTAQKYKFLNR